MSTPRSRIIVVLIASVLVVLAIVVYPTVSGVFTYNGVVSDGLARIPYARQFADVYPDSEVTISYFSGMAGEPTWNSEVGLYGRYVLSA